MHWILVLLALLPSAALAQQTPFDCESSAAHRQFDFWPGKGRFGDAQGKWQTWFEGFYSTATSE